MSKHIKYCLFGQDNLLCSSCDKNEGYVTHIKFILTNKIKQQVFSSHFENLGVVAL